MTAPREPGRSASTGVPEDAGLSRRSVLAGLGAGALVLAIRPGAALAEAPAKYGAEAMPGGVHDDPRLFLAIEPSGTVTFVCHRSDMGQGIRTSLAMVVADELEADWARMRVVQAPGDEDRFGSQDTDGSRSMRHGFQPMRRCAAAARTMLEQAAAARWKVPLGEVAAKGHAVVHARSGRSLGFGALATAAAALPVPTGEAVKPKAPARFRYVGRAQLPSIDGEAITTGKATYGIDVRLPGQLHAVVARPPVFGGKVASVDDAAARAVPGVLDVVRIDPVPLPGGFQPLGGLAVVAKTTWAAIQGRKALKITWDDGPNAGFDSAAYRAQLEVAARAPGKVVRNVGDVDAALAAADKRIVAEYYLPHLAQAPLEPVNATAVVRDDGAELWACTQAPQACREEVAKRLGLKLESVKMNVTLLGGGFGRKSFPDYVVEAALLSKAMKGAPVQVTWTRDDDLHHGYYHTVSVERLEGALDARGKTTGWRHRSVAPSIAATFGPDDKHEMAVELGMGLVNDPFSVPSMRIENPEAKAGHARIGWFRSVSNIPHAFAVQSFAAELAFAARQDPLAYLLELLGPARVVPNPSLGDAWNHGEDPARYQLDVGRLRAVTQRAADEAGWSRPLARGVGRGVAAHHSFLTYVAAVVQVAVEQGALTVQRVDLAVDCGPQVNPDRIRSQMEGAVIMGLTLALYGEIGFKQGRVQQNNFDTYRLVRQDDCPRDIRVHLVGGGDWSQPLGGVGEPGVPPIAPALCNAIFAATGKRIRALPIADQLRSS